MDATELEDLNSQYVRSVRDSDVGWFERHLAADFVCTFADGSSVDRAGFLQKTALPVGVVNIEVHDVRVRVMGDFALIHARTTYILPDGLTGSNRYTDAWTRQEGRWIAIAAHITPVRSGSKTQEAGK
jgi:ketosteroid isomerase-like protein